MHLVPDGQQEAPPEQQMAPAAGQQPHPFWDEFAKRQQVPSLGQARPEVPHLRVNGAPPALGGESANMWAKKSSHIFWAKCEYS